MAKARGDGLTGDLLAWEPPKVAAGFDPGAIRGRRLASQISQAVALTLKASGLPRAEVAQRMGDELGYPVSENMLANYASEGAEAHKITVERLVALMEATGCTDLLGFLAERFRKYQSLINLHLEEEAAERIEKFRAAEKAKWQAV